MPPSQLHLSNHQGHHQRGSVPETLTQLHPPPVETHLVQNSGGDHTFTRALTLSISRFNREQPSPSQDGFTHTHTHTHSFAPTPPRARLTGKNHARDTRPSPTRGSTGLVGMCPTRPARLPHPCKTPPAVNTARQLNLAYTRGIRCHGRVCRRGGGRRGPTRQRRSSGLINHHQPRCLPPSARSPPSATSRRRDRRCRPTTCAPAPRRRPRTCPLRAPQTEERTIERREENQIIRAKSRRTRPGIISISW